MTNDNLNLRLLNIFEIPTDRCVRAQINLVARECPKISATYLLLIDVSEHSLSKLKEEIHNYTIKRYS